jgi:hypothetical protein
MHRLSSATTNLLKSISSTFYRQLLCQYSWAGDKTAYLVTDLTVMAVTVIKKDQEVLVNICHAQNTIFFGIHGLMVPDNYIINNQELKSFICHAAHYSYERDLIDKKNQELK